MRTVRIISTQSDSVKSHESSATTWGQLREELSGMFSGVSDMKAIVRETRVTLEAAEAALPEGDFTVILSMKKIASGSTRYNHSQLKELRTKINNLFNDLLEEDFNETQEEVVPSLSNEERAEIEEMRRQGLL
jgi:hypothetical protein